MKKLLLVAVSLLVSFACSNENATPHVKENHELISSSVVFKSLGIGEDELDMENILTETSPRGQQLLLVSFKSTPSKTILNGLDSKGHITHSILIEIESKIRPEDHMIAFENNNFEGKLSFLSSTGAYFGFDFIDSKIVNMFLSASLVEKENNESSAKVMDCNGWTKIGGPMDCAGASLVSEPPISKALCYMSFGWCFGGKVLDCWLFTNCMPRPGVLINGNYYPEEIFEEIPFDEIQTVVKPKNLVNLDPALFNY